MIKLSAVIITFNEQRNIERCIASVKTIADEILIVDSYSTDQTTTIAEMNGARVIQHPFEGYIEQKNWALTQANYPYVLSLDADEWLDEVAIHSVLRLKTNWEHDAYALNRMNNYCGQWIRHGAWYPDTKIRLFRKDKGRWTGMNPHDRFEPDSKFPLQKIEGNILHRSYRTVEEHNKKTDLFSTIAAQAYFQKGKRATLAHIIFSPVFRFIRDYVLKLGILDGWNGFRIARYTAKEVYLKYVKLKAIQKSLL